MKKKLSIPVSGPNIIVIGAGHAGIEAAYAAQRMGARVTLLTIQLENIAQMSCNPSIGGIAKGHLVKEIDALGGVMPRAADFTGIHFKSLNQSKGPAVRATRSQNDKNIYRTYMKKFLENTAGLQIYQGMAVAIEVLGGRVSGVSIQDGSFIPADAVIVTTGTFLKGRIYIGNTVYEAGRANEPAASGLSQNLEALGFTILRLKTGTPMRLHADSIDWNRFTPQPGDEPPVPFSWYTNRTVKNRVCCYIGHTSEHLKTIIRDHIHQNPLYSGKIDGIGPRYCPSIEDKIMKFPDKPFHHFFLEPEGLNNKEIYINGISTSFPVDIQKRIIHSIPGLESAQFTRPAYAIEYDAIHPTQLNMNLESRSISRLFFAGQINGTSGYEEAASQGLMAGVNAVLAVKDEPPFILQRHEAYTSVMIDDLIHKGIDEPYRLFTSRAEYRLQLREDNAFARLGEYAFNLGLINRKAYSEQMRSLQKRRQMVMTLEKKKVTLPGEQLNARLFLKRPENNWDTLKEQLPSACDPSLSRSDIAFIEAEIKYEGYIEIQKKEIEKSKQMAGKMIPGNLDFFSIPGLSTEIRQKLTQKRPKTFLEAGNIPGVTPASLNAISIYLTIQSKKSIPKEHQ